MEPRIEHLTEKKLIGKKLSMSFAQNRTVDLWRSFMPRRKEIKNSMSSDLFSLQIYPPSFDFKNFNPTIEFEKWALIEVPDFDSIPEGMEPFTLREGFYAVFFHKGGPSKGPQIFQYIFGTWLPSSDYLLDSRPHFELLGEKYKNNDPSSEEEIWIPIKSKK
jgi:AraC family transcriptional regulator